MNDRIGKLCEQSKLYADNCTQDFTGDEPVVWMDYYTEKFAELIIANCCDQVRAIDAMTIRQYFGVEE